MITHAHSNSIFPGTLCNEWVAALNEDVILDLTWQLQGNRFLSPSVAVRHLPDPAVYISHCAGELPFCGRHHINTTSPFANCAENGQANGQTSEPEAAESSDHCHPNGQTSEPEASETSEPQASESSDPCHPSETSDNADASSCSVLWTLASVSGSSLSSGHPC